VTEIIKAPSNVTRINNHHLLPHLLVIGYPFSHCHPLQLHSKASDTLAKLHVQLDVSAGGLRAHVLVQSARSRIGISTGRCEGASCFSETSHSCRVIGRKWKGEKLIQLIISRGEASAGVEATGSLLTQGSMREFSLVNFCRTKYPPHMHNLKS